MWAAERAGTKAERLEKMLNKGTVTPLEYMLKYPC